ncbi:MAG: hypothetical protein ACHRHE_13040 [Tepidisphaerales bacterium]
MFNLLRLPPARPSHTFLRMRLWQLILPAALILAGCSNPDFSEDMPKEDKLFNASAMRIHPIFTQVKSWTGGEKPDGIDVMLEFQDPFGDPTKASGIVRFELYEYRKGNPEMRGARSTNPWVGSLASYDDQRARWNRTSRTYSFQLAYPQISVFQSYVLVATFKPTGEGRRLEARVVLPGQEEPSGSPTTQPAGIIPHS